MKKNNDWKERLGVTYSTNLYFAYQTDEAPEVETLPPDRQRLRVRIDRRTRGGKTDDLEALGKVLKVRCGVGGATKDGEIILQGDLRQKVADILQSEGYGVRVC